MADCTSSSGHEWVQLLSFRSAYQGGSQTQPESAIKTTPRVAQPGLVVRSYPFIVMCKWCTQTKEVVHRVVAE